MLRDPPGPAAHCYEIAKNVQKVHFLNSSKIGTVYSIHTKWDYEISVKTEVEKMKKTLIKSINSGFKFQSVFEAKLEFDIPKIIFFIMSWIFLETKEILLCDI